MDETYLNKIVYFVGLIKEQRRMADNPDAPHWKFELGRKYDKVLCDALPTKKVRYFIERSTGNIYGARSDTTPNLQWWFGNLDRCQLWDWMGYHGVPTHDDNVRPTGRYGPYIKYILV